MNLFLIRHAQSANNAKPEFERVCDPAITSIGTEQAIRTAGFFKNAQLDGVLTSAFRRALQTSTVIGRELQLPPKVLVSLHENGGCFSGWKPGETKGEPGLNESEIRNEFGAVHFLTPIGNDGWWSGKPRESLEDARKRAEQVANDFLSLASRSNERIACVTHADFLSLLLVEMLGSQVTSHPGYDDLKNTGITHLESHDKGWKLIELNRTPHLPDQLVTS